MERKRVVTLQIAVTVPAEVGNPEVAQAINTALDEPPCEWGEWRVGAALVVDKDAAVTGAAFDLLIALKLAVRYLEHPDVQAIPFALSASVAAKRCRKAIAKVED